MRRRCRRVVVPLRARALSVIADAGLSSSPRYKLLTLADGTQDLVARSIPTIENGGQFGRKPLLPPAKLTHLLGGPCPPVRDVTQFAHVGTDDKPSWGHQDLSTIVSMLSPNAYVPAERAYGGVADANAQHVPPRLVRPHPPLACAGSPV